MLRRENFIVLGVLTMITIACPKYMVAIMVIAKVHWCIT